MNTKITGDITTLPVKGKALDLKTEDELVVRTELGMIFAKPYLSDLKSKHGFHAILETPFVPLPGIDFAGPAVQNDKQDNEVFNYLHFKCLKKSMERNVHRERKDVCCIIDWSTDISIALESVVGNNPGTMEFIDIGVLTLGGVVIDSEDLFIGVQIVRLYINGRPYVQTLKVVKDLFPGHPDINIDIVLGKDFLDAFPGITLHPLFSEHSLEFIPWDHRGIENSSNFYESFFNVNEKGELLVYICGHSEKETSKSHARIPGDVGKFTDEKGAYGVFFGPNSPWNMSLLSKMKGTPVHERALIEGIIATSDLLIDGGFIFGNPTFSSVRVFTDSALVVEFLNSNAKLAEYQEREWRNKQGVKLGIAEPLMHWYNSTRDRYNTISGIPWVKKDLFIFEKVEKKRKGLQAARHLASCGLKAESYACNKDLGARYSNRGIASNEKIKSSDFLYMTIPRTTCNTFMVKQKISDFIESRDQASAKFSQDNPQARPKQRNSTEKIYISYFQPGYSYDFDGVILNFSSPRECNAMRILEIFDSSFMEEVLRIAKEKRGLPDSLEFFKEDDGRIHFFYRNTNSFAQDERSVLIDILMGDYSSIKNASAFKNVECRNLKGLKE